MKICPVGAEFFSMWTDRRTKKKDESDSRFSQFYERAQKPTLYTQNMKSVDHISVSGRRTCDSIPMVLRECISCAKFLDPFDPWNLFTDWSVIRHAVHTGGKAQYKACTFTKQHTDRKFRPIYRISHTQRLILFNPFIHWHVFLL